MLALPDFDRAFDPDAEPRQALADNSRLVDHVDQRGATAIEYRYFVAVNLDQQVVDSAAAQCGQQMLYRADGDTVLVAEHGAQTRVDNIFP